MGCQGGFTPCRCGCFKIFFVQAACAQLEEIGITLRVFGREPARVIADICGR